MLVGSWIGRTATECADVRGKSPPPLWRRIKVGGNSPDINPAWRRNYTTFAPSIFSRCPKAQVWAPESKVATQSVGTSTW